MFHVVERLGTTIRHMKGMTCLPHSGPGTPFKDEYDRLMHKAMNPDKPVYLSRWTVKGIEIIFPESARKRAEELMRNRGIVV